MSKSENWDYDAESEQVIGAWAAGCPVICTVERCMTSGEETKNGVLIALAPELLAWIKSEVEAEDNPATDRPHMIAARRLIARAEGRF